MSSKRTSGGRVSHLVVTLTPDDRATMEGWLRSTRCPYGLHKRVRAVLLVASGMPIVEVARRVDLERRFIYKWVARFTAGGCAGLLDLPRHTTSHGDWPPVRRRVRACCAECEQTLEDGSVRCPVHPTAKVLIELENTHAS